MAEFKLPELGEDIEEAEVLKVLVQVGDSVEKDQPVLELETDKATFEVPSTLAGRVSALHVSAGDTVKVGDALLTLEDGGAAAGEKEADEKKAGDRAEPEAEARQEKEGKKEPEEKDGEPGDEESRETEEPAAREEERSEEPEPEGGRAAAEEAEPERDERKAGRERDEEAGEEEPRERAPRPDREPRRREGEAAEAAHVAAGPATRRLARELGVDLARVEGSGSGGRISREDVKAAVRSTRAGAGVARGRREEREEREERRPLSGIEKAALRHLSASWSEIPHVTHHDHADVTELERARARWERNRDGSEVKLTVTALVVKACVAALKALPRVNASLDLEAEELVLKRHYHIGVAVDTEHGLLVPVLRDADARTTREIAAEIADLAGRARERKLSREEMQGATFTVTNLGGIGGTAFTPIVSRPEVAILGVSRTREELALRAGQVVKRLVLPLSLSYDHRVVNGADAARFVRHVAGLLEEPLHLLVES